MSHVVEGSGQGTPHRGHVCEPKRHCRVGSNPLGMCINAVGAHVLGVAVQLKIEKLD